MFCGCAVFFKICCFAVGFDCLFCVLGLISLVYVVFGLFVKCWFDSGGVLCGLVCLILNVYLRRFLVC